MHLYKHNKIVIKKIHSIDHLFIETINLYIVLTYGSISLIDFPYAVKLTLLSCSSDHIVHFDMYDSSVRTKL